MNLYVIDWGIVVALVALLFGAALYTSRYTKSVSAFLAANRSGGRYLISMANAMAGTGVISLVYWFEIYYEAGFTAYWWSSMTEPALIVIALSGWIVYRYRQTRAMTLAQFFEMRYSRNFRVFAGIVGFVSGIINFGIYPAVGARFFMALCGLAPEFQLLGITFSTYVTIMAGLLLTAIVFTFLGGQIAVMVTDFIQGAFANIVFVLLIGYLLFFVFQWDQIEYVLARAPEGKSLIHSMQVSNQEDFNFGYFLIAVAIVFYTFNSWQGTSGYNCCAKNAHEAKMAGVLYGWRFRVLLTVTIIVPIAVLTLLNHPDFATQAGELTRQLNDIEAPTLEQKQTLQNQMRIPFALALLLPTGLLGLVVAAMLAAFISTHDTYLHSWGSIFIQDVIVPFRRRPFSPSTHLWLLRLSILGVALFIFAFSLLIKPTQFIAMFFAITGAVFVGGAGSVIIGGLYWSRGSTPGAWSAMIVGMLLSAVSILAKQIDAARFEQLEGHMGWLGTLALFLREELTGQELTFIAMLCAASTYVLVSLLGPKQVTDMDALLHRDEHAVDENGAPGRTHSAVGRKTWLERLGIDREFTKGDRAVAYVSVGWPLAWTALFAIVTIWNLFTDVPDSWWMQFWRVWIWVFTGGALLVTVWFTIGGFVDLRFLVRRIKTHRGDPSDDGRVPRRDD